jgi:hypothetical protein
MTVWWCRGCGMEDTRSHDRCPSCNSALQEADLEWLTENKEPDETVFEIETEPHERAAIVDALMAAHIRHRWEGPQDLVVADNDADRVDAILDEVLGADEDDESDGGESIADEASAYLADADIYLDADPYGTADDNGYEMVSKLFLITGKLLRNNRDDQDDVDDFTATVNQVLATGTPFGVDEETWADIQSAARNLSTALQADVEAPVNADLKALHNQLQLLV